MTSSAEAYNYVLASIEMADSYFAFRCIEFMIEEFGKCFTEYKREKRDLIDAKCDRWAIVFPKYPTLKNQDNEHRR